VRGDDDVRDVVADRVALSQPERGLADGVDAVQRAAAELGDVVDDRRGEQDVEPVEVAVVEQVPVERDQLDDRGTVVRGERHCADDRPAGPGTQPGSFGWRWFCAPEALSSEGCVVKVVAL
jgi:hypothetical protein